MNLTPSDLDDIRRLLPVHGTRWVMQYLGCSRQTVLRRARQLGLDFWPQGNTGRRRADFVARDVPGVSKVCGGCEESKPLTSFWSKPSGYMGRHDRCTACASIARHTR